MIITRYLALGLCLAGLFLPVAGGKSYANELEEALALHLASRGPSDGMNITVRDALTQFYAAHLNNPVWRDGQDWSKRAGIARRYLGTAYREGLQAEDYATGASLPPQHDISAEIALTKALIRYISDVSIGRRAPAASNPELFGSLTEIDASALLLEGMANRDFEGWLQSLPPSLAQYSALRDARARMALLAESGLWPVLDAGAYLREGDNDPRIVTLRRQLALLHDLADSEIGTADFDATLATAVRTFQARHGLGTDGIVGPKTRHALNVSPADRARQISLNMERWRWIAKGLGKRHVLINVAGFELIAMHDGLPVFRSPIIVGRADRHTPLFDDQIVNLVFSPTWTAPPTIARKDILPKIQADPGFFKSMRMRVFDGWSADAAELDPQTIDWAKISPDALRFKFKQDAGPDNALGGVRFTLTNKSGIFLHDTPNKALFDKPVRAFSSGCIRVRDSVALARFALRDDPAWPTTRVQAAMETGKTQLVTLSEPLPVHITYITAWVDDAGRLQFRDDIYRRDQALRVALGLDGE